MKCFSPTDFSFFRSVLSMAKTIEYTGWTFSLNHKSLRVVNLNRSSSRNCRESINRRRDPTCTWSHLYSLHHYSFNCSPIHALKWKHSPQSYPNDYSLFIHFSRVKKRLTAIMCNNEFFRTQSLNSSKKKGKRITITCLWLGRTPHRTSTLTFFQLEPSKQSLMNWCSQIRCCTILCWMWLFNTTC